MILEAGEMKLIRLPFQPIFKDAMLSGRKTMTTRFDRNGIQVGDYFNVFGRAFSITAIVRMRLGTVWVQHYREEGFDTAEGFGEMWCKIHPKRQDPELKVWAIRFKICVKGATVQASLEVQEP